MNILVAMVKVSFPVFILASLFILPAESCAETYEECILENMKDVQEKTAAYAINKACLIKTTPKKCRKYIDQKDVKVDSIKNNIFKDLIPKEKLDLIIKEEESGIFRNDYERCIDECSNANLYSKFYGECSKN